MPKQSALEDAVLREVSKGVTGLDFTSSSEWDKFLGASQVGLRVRESSAYKSRRTCSKILFTRPTETLLNI